MNMARIAWGMSSPFIILHLLALATLWVFPPTWPLVALCVGSYALRMFAITGGYHRYFSHRTYKMGRVPQFLMACLGSASVQKGVLWWAANHRHHHRHSDQPEDIHSPLQSGFWWSHVGWILSPQHDETLWDQIPDLAKFPELVWVNRFHMVPVVVYAAAMAAAFGWAGFAWGFVVSTVLLWHGTFTINSLSHVFGSRRYSTTDTSRNNLWLALITLGEGWHNNHHAYQSSTRQGFHWWEIDVSYYALRALSWVGVTRDLREPPLALLEAKRLRPRRRFLPLLRRRVRQPETSTHAA